MKAFMHPRHIISGLIPRPGACSSMWQCKLRAFQNRALAKAGKLESDTMDTIQMPTAAFDSERGRRISIA
jgi:hypothetical protein